MPEQEQNQDNRVIIGSHVLESLSLGMYSNPFDIYREYIQNAVDAIDQAIEERLIDKREAEIIIEIARDTNIRDTSGTIIIRDNATGIESSKIKEKLLDVGISDKDNTRTRGFRGIGRLGGLGYSKRLVFKTSAKGEKTESILTFDGQLFKELIAQGPKETMDAATVMQKICSISIIEHEEPDTHYFEVRLEDIYPAYSDLLNDEKVTEYISTVCPVNFDSQLFPYAAKINNFYEEKQVQIDSYSIRFAKRAKSIYKPYRRSICAGKNRNTRTNDQVKDVKLLYERASDGKPLYIGWLAITDFSGQISDKSIQGIRLRKGNILVGNETLFSRFFPSEGEAANKMFAGEIHALHPQLILNAKRDDFEPSAIYTEFAEKLGELAGDLNRKYRRGTSAVSSARRKITDKISDFGELKEEIEKGNISSDAKREELSRQLEAIKEKIESYSKEMTRAQKAATLSPETTDSIEQLKTRANDLIVNEYPKLSKLIIESNYSSKYDLPTGYSRNEKKLYQKILAAIDTYFGQRVQEAEDLKGLIIEALTKKDKKDKRKTNE